ncbi:hypothetical protein ACFQY8_01140 [Alloscardovia venturai]|uniref:Uncharacterized protein n=1 Tax=Alloscardovia venturai TaxID=1769421 RepID=A0ABW2Y4F8_9BIFI
MIMNTYVTRGEEVAYMPRPSQMSGIPEKDVNAGPPDRDRKAGNSAVTILAVIGVSGGCGTSSFALQLGRYFRDIHGDICVVDADFSGGGIDILAGYEEAEGLRWHDVHTPLGHIDSRGFVQEMIEAEGMFLLPCHPWGDGKQRDSVQEAEAKATRQSEKSWWEIKAVFEALGQNFDLLVVDCGRQVSPSLVQAWSQLEPRVEIIPIIMGTLSLCSLARIRSEVDRWKTLPSPLNNCVTAVSPLVISSQIYQHRKAHLIHTASSQSVDEIEAERFVGAPIVGQYYFDSKISLFSARGFGIAPASKRNSLLYQNVSDRVEAGKL